MIKTKAMRTIEQVESEKDREMAQTAAIHVSGSNDERTFLIVFSIDLVLNKGISRLH